MADGGKVHGAQTAVGRLHDRVITQLNVVRQLVDRFDIRDDIFRESAGGFGIDAVLRHALFAPFAFAAVGNGEHRNLVAHLIAGGGSLLAQFDDRAGGLVSERGGGLAVHDAHRHLMHVGSAKRGVCDLDLDLVGLDLRDFDLAQFDLVPIHPPELLHCCHDIDTPFRKSV